MSGTLWLKCAAAVSFLMAAGQALISTWPAAAAYFHAPPSLLDNRVRLLMVGGTAALLPALFGLYALSGAGVIRRMPLVRTVLVAVGSLFLLRGMFIILTFLAIIGIRNEQVWLAGAASHVMFLATGVLYLAGTVLNWPSLARNACDAGGSSGPLGIASGRDRDCHPGLRRRAVRGLRGLADSERARGGAAVHGPRATR